MLIKVNSVVKATVISFCLFSATQAEPTTQPYGETESAERDRLLTLLPCGKGYIHGVESVLVSHMDSSHTLELPSSKLAIVVDGWSDIDLTRSFFHGDFSASRKETISATTDNTIDIDRQVRISMTPARPGIHVLDWVFEPGQGKINIDRSWIEPIKLQQGNELNSFEFVVSLTRQKIMDMPWPESAKSLAIWETYGQDLIAAGDCMQKFDCGSLIVFASVRRGGKLTVASGKVFATANNRWLGDIWIAFKPRNGDDDKACLVEILSRLKFLGN